MRMCWHILYMLFSVCWCSVCGFASHKSSIHIWSHTELNRMCIFAWNWRGGSSSNEKHDFSQAYFCLKQHAKCRYGKKHITHWGMKFILACILCFYMEMYENILLTCSLSFSIWFFIISLFDLFYHTYISDDFCQKYTLTLCTQTQTYCMYTVCHVLLLLFFFCLHILLLLLNFTCRNTYRHHRQTNFILV